MNHVHPSQQEIFLLHEYLQWEPYTCIDGHSNIEIKVGLDEESHLASPRVCTNLCTVKKDRRPSFTRMRSEDPLIATCLNS